MCIHVCVYVCIMALLNDLHFKLIQFAFSDFTLLVEHQDEYTIKC